MNEIASGSASYCHPGEVTGHTRVVWLGRKVDAAADDLNDRSLADAVFAHLLATCEVDHDRRCFGRSL
jgi:hypothetical protein